MNQPANEPTVLDNQVAITWLGHAAFRVDTPGGKAIVIDPWLKDNPACPQAHKQQPKVDLMLVTHGHFDHCGDAVALGLQHQPKTVGAFEMCLWLGAKGLKQTMPMNKGGTQTIEGLKVTMVHADHSSGILDGSHVVYGGEACGYVIELENGFKIYHAGDTNVFGDMALIRELYAPDLAMLPIGGLFTMAPREAALACRLLQPRYVVPMHFGTFPPLTGTPDQLREALHDLPGTRVVELAPGDTLR